jgi:hypothetical protein
VFRDYKGRLRISCKVGNNKEVNRIIEEGEDIDEVIQTINKEIEDYERNNKDIRERD